MSYEINFLEDGTATIELPSGASFNLQQVSSIALHAIQSSQVNKPKAPFVEITNRKGKKRRERNPDDVTYQEELAAWTSSRQSKLMQYLVNNGITDEVPNGYENFAEGYVDIENEAELKYFWVGEQIKEDELEMISTAIIEMAQPTEEGIKDAEDEFPSNG